MKAQSLVVTVSNIESIIQRDIYIYIYIYPTLTTGVKTLNHGNKIETILGDVETIPGVT